MKQIFLLSMLVGSACAALAQNSHPDKLPWVEGKFPPVAGRYEYKVAQGEGSTLKAARDDAFSGVLVDLGNAAGMAVDSRSIVDLKSELGYSAGASQYSESDSQSTTFNIRRQGVNASLTKVGEYYEYRHGRYLLWELYEVSTSGAFKTFTPEYTTRYGFSGAWRSAIVPGWGQLYKGKAAKGVTLLAAEALLVTGAVYSEMRRSDSFRKSQETTNLNIVKEYRNRADSWELYRNVAVGAAAGVYLINLLDAALAKGKVKYAAIPRSMHLHAATSNGVQVYGVAFYF
jgi:hypothetical protein